MNDVNRPRPDYRPALVAALLAIALWSVLCGCSSIRGELVTRPDGTEVWRLQIRGVATDFLPAPKPVVEEDVKPGTVDEWEAWLGDQLGDQVLAGCLMIVTRAVLAGEWEEARVSAAELSRALARKGRAEQ